MVNLPVNVRYITGIVNILYSSPRGPTVSKLQLFVPMSGHRNNPNFLQFSEIFSEVKCTHLFIVHYQSNRQTKIYASNLRIAPLHLIDTER